MAMDPWARAAAKTGEWASLFRYLNGQSTTRQLEILEDLQSQGVLVGSLKLDHKTEWETSRIGDGAKRLELGCILVLEKAARMKSWTQFVDANASRFRALHADDWQKEMEKFWGTGPNPGLGATTDFTPLMPLPDGPESWKVTDFSVASVAGVQTLGVTVMWGKITFSTYSEPAKTSERIIGLVGISGGKSVSKLPGKMPDAEKVSEQAMKLAKVDPNVAAAAKLSAASIPDVFKAKFPNLAKFLLEEDYSAAEAVARKAFPNALAKVTRYMPAVNALWKTAGSVSGGKAAWDSVASGPAIPLKQQSLVPGDFRGTCYGFGVATTIAVGNVGGMVLMFGMNDWKSPASARGYTGFYSAGWSGQVPALGVTGTAFWGEII